MDSSRLVCNIKKKLAEACGKGISEQMVRSALVDFQKHGFLTKQSTGKSTKGYTVITVENWEFYQKNEETQPSNQPVNQPSTNQAPTTNKNEKNNIYSQIQDFYREAVAIVIDNK